MLKKGMATMTNQSIDSLKQETLLSLEKSICEEKEEIWRDEIQKEKLNTEVTKIIEETLEIICNVRDKNITSIDALAHLSETRKELFLSSLSVIVFETNINSDNSAVEFVRDGKPFLKSIELSSPEKIIDATNWQIADIVFEAILMILQMAGLPIPTDEHSIRAGLDVVREIVTANQAIVAMVNQLVKCYEGGEKKAMAKEIITIVYRLFKDGLLIDVFRALYSGRTKSQWALLFAKLTAYLIIIGGSAGLAIIASLISLIVGSVTFTKKLKNMKTLASLSARPSTDE